MGGPGSGPRKGHRDPKVPYTPTKKQIRLECEQIQLNWTKATEMLRRGGSNEPYELPSVIKITDHMVRRHTWNTPDEK